MDIKLNFGEAVKKLDLEADTFFIVHFDSKDPDDMTTIAQGDIVKLSAAVAFATGQLNEDALIEIARDKLSNEEFKKLQLEVKNLAKH